MPVSRAVRLGALFAVLAVAGYLLGGCAGGDGSLSDLTGRSDTGPRPTLPILSSQTDTDPGTTDEVPTTSPETTTTVPTEPEPPPTSTEEPPPTSTEEPPPDDGGLAGLLALILAALLGSDTDEPTDAGEAPTTTDAAPTTTEEAPTTTEETPPTTTDQIVTVTPEPTSSEGDSPWGWVVLALGLAVAGLVSGLLWRRRRADAASWESALAELQRRSRLALDDVAREGSVATGRVQALADEARSLEVRAFDDRSRAAAAPLRQGLDELAGALQADRALRLGTTAPTAEQLSYSAALIQAQATQLRALLEQAPPAGPAA